MVAHSITPLFRSFCFDLVSFFFLRRRGKLVFHEDLYRPLEPILIGQVQDGRRLLAGKGQAHLHQTIEALVIAEDTPAGKFAQHAGLIVPNGQLQGRPVFGNGGRGPSIWLLLLLLLLLLQFELYTVLDMIQELQGLLQHVVALAVDIASDQRRHHAKTSYNSSCSCSKLEKEETKRVSDMCFSTQPPTFHIHSNI
jgi:hypothetical protein